MRAQGKDPRFVPSFVKSRWQKWTPKSKYSQVGGQNGSRDLTSTNTAYGRGVEVEERAAGQAAAAGVDRHTSVRSVMTLPSYSQSAQENEQIIGREGERAGMDTVVEFPETNEEEETRRDDQMESLYQIRQARRRELEEREERRRERREARERGDFARLEELRRDSRQRANQSTTTVNGGLSASAATLIAEHQSRGRDRRVSAVSYADLGQVRHDGTRLRANSAESERGGLLDGAAPMGENESNGRGRGLSDATSLAADSIRPSHRREGSSALSVSTNGSDLENTASYTPADSDPRPRTSNSTGTSNSSPTANRFTPEDSTGSDDIGDSRIPTIATEPDSATTQPPEYDHLDWGDAPAYQSQRNSLAQRHSMANRNSVRRNESNASQRAFDQVARQRVSALPPRLPSLHLPTINVEGATPPITPVTPNMSVGSPNTERTDGRRGVSGQDELFDD